MDTLQNELNGIQDELILRLITQMAKPTVTLTQIKAAALKEMEELEMRGALGRLWRACKVYRHSLTTANGAVLYWPEDKLKVVASSGIAPQMPEGVPLPECIRHILQPASIAQEYKKQEAVQEVKEEKLTRHEENMRKSKWQLVPISQTAALPMRPLAEGKFGNARRSGGAVSEVLAALFRYRDIRLSIDGVASLIPHITRTDVARVISQTVNGTGKKYIIRFEGATRFDNTYQWNHEFCYPYSDRHPSDGERVSIRHADPETKDDEKLDHIEAEQLTESETESEIARLIREAAQNKVEEQEEIAQPKIDEQDESEEEEQGFCAILPADMPWPNTRYEEPKVDIAVTLTPEQVMAGDFPEVPTMPIEQQSGTVNDRVIEANVLMPERRGQKITISDTAFRAGFFTDGVMIIELDHGRLELTREQTEQIADLLGPHYMRKVAA